jgi:hypothetical protein
MTLKQKKFLIAFGPVLFSIFVIWIFGAMPYEVSQKFNETIVGVAVKPQSSWFQNTNWLMRKLGGHAFLYGNLAVSVYWLIIILMTPKNNSRSNSESYVFGRYSVKRQTVCFFLRDVLVIIPVTIMIASIDEKVLQSRAHLRTSSWVDVFGWDLCGGLGYLSLVLLFLYKTEYGEKVRGGVKNHWIWDRLGLVPVPKA